MFKLRSSCTNVKDDNIQSLQDFAGLLGLLQPKMPDFSGVYFVIVIMFLGIFSMDLCEQVKNRTMF